MGLGGGFSAGAGADALKEILKRRFGEALDRQRLQQEQERIELSRKAQQDATDYKNLYIQGINEQRQANADRMRQQAADKLATDVPTGGVLDAAMKGTLTAGGYGGPSFIDHQLPTLPSTATQTGTTATAGPPVPMRIRGMMINPGHAEQDVWRGTASQQDAARQRQLLEALANNPNVSAAIREYAQINLATGSKGSLPSNLFQPDTQPVYQVGADGTMRNLGSVVRGARVMNAPRPPADPNARIQGRLMMDDPQLPRGVQDYLAQLRGKYDDFNAAADEFNRAMPSLHQAHPNLSSIKAMNALRSQYSGGGHLSGDALLEELLQGGGGAAGNPSGGSTPGAVRIQSIGGVPVSRGGRGGAPLGALAGGAAAQQEQSVTAAELQAIAQRKGTSVEQEKQRAAAAGYIIR